MTIQQKQQQTADAFALGAKDPAVCCFVLRTVKLKHSICEGPALLSRRRVLFGRIGRPNRTDIIFGEMI